MLPIPLQNSISLGVKGARSIEDSNFIFPRFKQSSCKVLLLQKTRKKFIAIVSSITFLFNHGTSEKKKHLKESFIGEATHIL